MILLDQLESNDIRRHRPLEGAWFRQSILIPIEVTDSPEQRAAVKVRREAGGRKRLPWKRIGKWKIASRCFDDLHPVWTDHTEWTFDNPTT